MQKTLNRPADPVFPKHLRPEPGADGPALLSLHLQASEWYESRNEREPAIRHALAGQAWSRAAYLIDQVADDLLARGAHGELQAWLESLREPALASRPRLLFVVVYLYLDRGDLAQAGNLLERIAAADERMAGYQACLRAGLALHSEGAAPALELASQALRLLPLEAPFWRALAAGWSGQALAAGGQFEAAAQAYARALAEADQTGCATFGLDFALGRVDCLRSLGRIRVALGFCQERLARLFEQTFDPIAAARVYNRWADLLIESGRPDEGLAAALQAEKMAGGERSVIKQARLAQARAYLALREAETAVALLQAGDFRLEGKLLRIDVELRLGHIRQTSALFLEMGFDPGEELCSEPAELRRLAARLLLAQGQARLACARLEALYDGEQRAGLEGGAVETLIWLALARQALGDEQASLDALSQALFWAAPQGWVGPFLRGGKPLARLLYQAGAQDIQPAFIGQLLDRMLVE